MRRLGEWLSFGGAARRREPPAPPDVGLDFSEFQFRHGACGADMADAERAIRRKLPRDYLDFMAAVDGGEGWLGAANYLILFRLIDLHALNRSYQSDLFAPGLTIIGSSGGGAAYAFDHRVTPPPVVAVPWVGMCLEDVEPVAPTFVEFLQALAAGWEDPNGEEA